MDQDNPANSNEHKPKFKRLSVLDRKELKSDDRSDRIFTVPNVISMFRIILIPFLVWTYVCLEQYVVSIILLAVSAFSDIIDGIIARKFNMTSEFGKLIDPVADKFTQGALMLCLVVRYPFMLFLVIAFVLREIVMIIFGTLLKKKTSHFSSAKWYGKVNTVVLEGSVIFLIVFGPFIPKPAITIVAIVLTSLSLFTVCASLILYVIYYLKIFESVNAENCQKAGSDIDPEEKEVVEPVDPEVNQQAIPK